MSARMEQLARPKPNLQKYPDRRSVYWLDELPVASKGSTTTFDLTPRWAQLALKKLVHPSFQENRSPAWQVSAATLQASPSERVCHLAIPRPPAKGWQPDRPLLATQVSKSMRTAAPSPRICQLSQPRKSAILLPDDEHKPSARGLGLTKMSPRIHLLAIPKSDHPEHQQDRPVLWTVPRSALCGLPSERIQVLAQPKQRRALFEEHDPYCVSPAALYGTASLRLLQLSAPLPRKCRKK
ncbi:theg spermatid protein [Brienomyrus brachyistius]|uniref:theg spermatid protein n=1 Tax=Brienomyrus brachyistius TaxID=42636 RepID=UPI0020B28E74|nr:theg spermatid protein [Brienomyrus brachyistius]XP_048844981.1 theg spermatid protein [Brienomyrus brachyistius]